MLRRKDNRSRYLTLLVVSLFLVLVFRLGYLQVGRYHYYRNLSDRNGMQIVPAPRGRILDRWGEILVTNRPYFRISHCLSQVPMDQDKLVNLSQLVGVDWRVLEQKIRDQYRNRVLMPVELVGNVDSMTLARVEEHLTDFSGILVDYKPVRYYVYPHMAAHLLGYVREISKPELYSSIFKGYRLGDVIGRDGVEQVCEGYLRGRNGWRQLEVDARGWEIRPLDSVEPLPGCDVYLTIDAKIQSIAEEALGNHHGAVVVMNPQNGAILAMVSKPDFDPNTFVEGVSPAEWKRLAEDRSHPLLNRVIQGTYPPGSLFKVVTAAAALEEGITNRERIIVSTGEFRLGGLVFKDWKEGGHGKTDIVKAISHSVNTYFYQMGYELPGGVLAKYARKFGLGELTGINLSGEKKGFVPTPEWKKKALGEPWYPGDGVNMAIGQGFILVTPLQVANMYSAIANGGTLYKPQVVQKIVSQDGQVVYSFEKRILGKLSLSDSTLAILREGLRKVVEEGTARYSFLGSRVEVAGKTGTAQNPVGEPNAWFVGYAPYTDPNLLVVVLVEYGGWGAGTATKIARQILERGLEPPTQIAQGRGEDMVRNP